MLNAKTCQPAKTQHIKSLSVFVLGSILSLAACQNDTAQTPETTQVEPKNLVAVIGAIKSTSFLKTTA